jgi:sarcosine oxidase
MTRSFYEYIVLGCGGIGSATAFWLSRRAGAEVLGLEQFELGHSRGGSQDFSRIIRLTYHDDTYTRLTPHTYMAWAVIEDESAVKIVHKTGGLTLALKGDRRYQASIENYARSMAAHGIPFDRLNADEVMRRFPQWHLDEEVDAIYQADMGLVDAIKGNAAHVAIARQQGATFIEGCPVTDIRPFEGGVELDTPKGRFTCRRLIVTAGGWTDKLLAKLNMTLRITVTEEQVTYYATPNLKEFAIGRFPTFIWEGDEAVYGFPVYGEVATKVGLDASGPEVDPDRRTYRPDPVREGRAETWLTKYLPGFLGPILYTKSCQYAMPRDRGFVIDRLPGYPQISVFVGAGHGYKFAALFGKILSELAIDGQTCHPIEAFTINRPAINDPDFPPSFHPVDMGGRGQ